MVQKGYNMHPPGVETPTPHNGKNNPYQFPPGVGTPPTQNGKGHKLQRSYTTTQLIGNIKETI